MPEKITISWQEIRDSLMTAGLFSTIGISIGIGKLLLLQNERLSWRLILGRALSTGGLSMAAGAILVWIPAVPLLGQIGIAAGLASLGTSGLERLLTRLLGGMSDAVKNDHH